MKIQSIVVFFLICSLANTVKAQFSNSKALIRNMQSVVNKVTSAEYRFHSKYTKMTKGEDTTVTYREFQYCFEKNTEDHLLGFKISSKPIDKGSIETLYNGEKLYSLYSWTGALEVADVVKDSLYVKKSKGSIQSYPLFAYINNLFGNYTDSKIESDFKIIEDETIDGESCYRVRQEITTGPGTSTEIIVYVQKITGIPVKIQISIGRLIGDVQQVQKFEYWATNVLVNNGIDPKRFQKNSMSYTLEKNYAEEEGSSSDLLKIGSKAPDWQLKSIDGRTVKSSDFNGKIVVMDFWFKACLPCVDQMMALQELHSKFSAEELVVIGVNTVDDPIRDKLKEFLNNRRIKSVNVVGGKLIQKSFKVVASPTLYVLGRDGSVIYALEGYSTTLVKDISELIKSRNN